MRVGWRLVALSGDDGDDADDASTWQNRLKVVESGKKSWCLKKTLRHFDGFFLVGGEGILNGGRSLMISWFLINCYQLLSNLTPWDERAFKLGMKNWMKFLAAWVYSTRCLCFGTSQ